MILLRDYRVLLCTCRPLRCHPHLAHGRHCLGVMKKLLLALVMLITACGGGDILTQIGSTLLKVRAAYLRIDDTQTKVERAAELVCREPPPAAVNVCADAIQSLSEADRANALAREAIVAATSVYNAVNGLDDVDAGAP